MTMGAFPYAQDSVRFLNVDRLDQQRFAIVGIPWDGSVTNRPGARFGPAAIRRSSLMLCDAIHPVFDCSPIALTGDYGDLNLPNASGLAAARSEIERQLAPLVATRHCICLGGDHSVTLGILRALYQVHGKMSLIHFDAHCDTWFDHFDEPSGHGTWVYEAISQGLVDPKRTVQIGIRSSGAKQVREFVNHQGGQIFDARSLWGQEGPLLDSMVQSIVQRMENTPVYLTFDIDCIDPAFAPATGTPEPAGLTSSQGLYLIEQLSAQPLNFVGMDVVEVAPPYDHAELTSSLAATLVWSYLSGQCARTL